MNSKVDEEVTLWIAALGEGDEAAAQRVWNQYFERLTALVRNKLGHVPKRAFDEEDVAIS